MKKWLIGIGILLAIAAMYYYSKKEKSVSAESETESETETDSEGWQPKERGEAHSIDDLPLACQDKFLGWANWMHSILGTSNKWADSLKVRGEGRGNTLDQQLEIEFVNMYNRNAKTAQCDE